MKKLSFLISPLLFTAFFIQAQQLPKVPELNGHVFNSIEAMRSPFIRTQFGLNMSMANTSVFNSQSVEVGDTTLFSLRNELLYVGLSLRYSQRVKDWANFFMRLNYSARLGTGAQSILTQGISSITSTETGVKFKLSSGKKHQLAMYYSLTNTQASIVDVTAYVNDLIDGADDPSVTQKIPSLISGGGLTFSYAPSHWLGINTDMKMAYGETLKRGESKWQYFYALNMDFYFEELIGFPISLVIGGSTNTQVNTFSIHGEQHLQCLFQTSLFWIRFLLDCTYSLYR
ncbi:hypothetical protein [Reichenbachiella ulvae]|uniref:Type IX secretion system membrane protein PorP/SprF n=1 Tax=Reichenbachiella ulvae TaxID=2980104 RepID=A0ABT3CV17_9BACT|nr:hypothetical protein [Reichenbachiella ulvae]MCV9387545.1 hypothetical protein [Reichenbachiella ulvae]